MKKICFPVLTLLLTPMLTAQEAKPHESVTSQNGMKVALSVAHVENNKTPGVFREGDDLAISFTITDSAGNPMPRLFPAAWMDIRLDGKPTDERLCSAKTRTFLSGSLMSKAEIDLNVFYVVSLNTDGSITVVDPLFGFGGSKLLAMAQLESPGDDWAMTANQQRLFVSMPRAGKVAVLNTTSWKVIAAIEVGQNPRRVQLQNDDQFLWVARDNGVTAIATDTMEVSASIHTGTGPHDLAVDQDNSHLYVSNAGSGVLSVLDLRKREKITDLPVGRDPVSISYSARARVLLVASRGDGTITAIDAQRHTVRSTMPAQPGLTQVAFAPDGRLAMAINPETDELHIIDSALGRIVQTGHVSKRPAQIAYTDELAYIMHEGDDVTLMVPLGEIGVQGKPIPLADFPSAPLPPADPATASIPTSLVKAPAERAVIFPNPREGSIYYYREGMAAPMGQFNNYGHTPRSLKVLDRTLQEMNAPGRYHTTAHIKKPGIYDVVFFLENPRISHCFELIVEPDPVMLAERREKEVNLRYINRPHVISAGGETPVQFQITNWRGEPMKGIRDVTVLLMAPGGAWHRRVAATAHGDGYGAVVKPPRPGFYYVHVKSPSVGLRSTNTNYLVVQAVDPKQHRAAQANGPGGSPQ